MSDSSEQRDPVRRPAATDDEFQRSLLTAINDASPDGILVVDEKGIVVSHNRRFLEIWKIPPEHVTGTQPGSAVGTSDDPLLASVVERVNDRHRFLQRVQELYASPRLDDHCEIELTDGRTLERHSTGLRGEQDQYLGRVWFFRDVTAHKQTETALQALARHDPLTGAMNHRYYAERAKQEFARAKRHQTPLAIAEFDIDHFKQINDRYGHAAGDEVLKAVCNASQGMMRETNLFARIGGEEFVVLLAGSDIDGAAVFAERLRVAAADASVLVDGEKVSCTISVGVAARRADDTTAEDCLKRADRAMYRAKARGRNRVEVDSGSGLGLG